MSVRRAKISGEKEEEKISELGIIRYQIFDLNSLGSNISERQIDYRITTDSGPNINDSVIIEPNNTISVDYQGNQWIIEII